MGNLVMTGKLITPHTNGRNLTLMLQRPRKWLTSTCAGLARIKEVVPLTRERSSSKGKKHHFFIPFTCNACKVFKIKAKYSDKKKKKKKKKYSALVLCCVVCVCDVCVL